MIVNATRSSVDIQSHFSLIPSTFLFENYEKLSVKKGSEYEYTEYEPLFDFVNPDKKAYYVVCDNYVTLTDGTGIVHIAPAFGEDDANVGRNYDLPFVQLVDEKGEMKPEVTDFAGKFCKDADEGILRKLGADKLLFKALKFEHSYPFCWRCDTPLIYYARETWFVKMTAVKDKLLKNNRAINWMPDNIKEGRMGNFLENVIDWGLFVFLMDRSKCAEKYQCRCISCNGQIP